MLTRYTEWRSLRTVRLALHLKPQCATLARVLRSAPVGMKTIAALQPALLGSLTLALLAPTLFGNTVTVSLSLSSAGLFTVLHSAVPFVGLMSDDRVGEWDTFDPEWVTVMFWFPV